MVKVKYDWNGLSNSDRAELDKVLGKVLTKATIAGYCCDVFAYLTEALDCSEVVDMLSDFGVNFVKEERDAILDGSDDEDDNISTIANYISNEIDYKNIKADIAEIVEMNDEEFEFFLESSSNCFDYEEVIKEFLSDKPSVRKQFIKFCVKKMTE